MQRPRMAGSVGVAIINALPAADKSLEESTGNTVHRKDSRWVMAASAVRETLLRQRWRPHPRVSTAGSRTTAVQNPRNQCHKACRHEHTHSHESVCVHTYIMQDCASVQTYLPACIHICADPSIHPCIHPSMYIPAAKSTRNLKSVTTNINPKPNALNSEKHTLNPKHHAREAHRQLEDRKKVISENVVNGFVRVRCSSICYHTPAENSRKPGIMPCKGSELQTTT